jgi:hypothetical protein
MLESEARGSEPFPRTCAGLELFEIFTISESGSTEIARPSTRLPSFNTVENRFPVTCAAKSGHATTIFLSRASTVGNSQRHNRPADKARLIRASIVVRY